MKRSDVSVRNSAKILLFICPLIIIFGSTGCSDPDNKSGTLNSTVTEDKVKVLDSTNIPLYYFGSSMSVDFLELADGHDYFVTTTGYTGDDHQIIHAVGCRRCNRNLDRKDK